MNTMDNFDIQACPLEGANLIEASAGTGKTHAITGLYLRLIVEKKLQPGQILVVTFTEAATEELRGRIRTRLRNLLQACDGALEPDPADTLLAALALRCRESLDDRLRVQTALRGFDEAAIYTIHGFCHRMLMDFAFESASLFDTELVTDDMEMARTLAVDFLREKLYDENLGLLGEYAAFDRGYADPKALTDLYGKMTPGAEIRVDEYAAGLDARDGEGALAVVRDAYDRAAESWRAASAEVTELLAGAMADKALNGTKYKNISTRLSELSLYFRGRHPMSAGVKPEMFAPGVMRENANKGKSAPEHHFFAACGDLAAARAEARRRLDGYLQKLKVESIDYLRRGIAARKIKLNRRSFDDLLSGMHAALGGGPSSFLAKSVRERFSAALIDEFQDTDPVQYSIFSGIFSGDESVLFLIGDPKQAVYAFRGADIFAYMEASRNARRRYTLGVNWRSEPDLVQASHSLFGSHPNPFVFREIALPGIQAAERPDRKEFTESGAKRPPIIIWRMQSGDGENALTTTDALRLAADSTAAEIARLLSPGSRAMIGDRALRPADIAVLVRTHRQGEKIHERLTECGVPAVRYGAGSVFDSGEAVEMFTIIRAAAEPANEASVKAALGTDAVGLNADELAALIEDEHGWDRVITRFHEYRASWERRGFMHMFRDVMARESIQQRLIALPDGERRLTNFLHLAELAHCAESAKGLGVDGTLKWFAGMMGGGTGDEDTLLRLETDDDAVKIITLHRSKGLEFPVVFCTFSWYAPAARRVPTAYHDPDRNNAVAISLSPDDARAGIFAGREEIAEEMRLLYVGVTRAKCRCYLAWGAIRESSGSPLAYLFHGAPAADGHDIGGAMKEIMKAVSPGAVGAALRETALRVPGVLVEPLPDTGVFRYRADRQGMEPAGCRDFKGVIKRDWRMSSFSMMASGSRRMAPQRDHDAADISRGPTGQSEPGDSILDFPRGTRAGSFMHSVFELMDFTASTGSWAALVRERLHGAGFDARWEHAVLSMLANVMEAPLGIDEGAFSLASVTRENRINELEFLFPIEKITSPGLSALLDGSGISGPGAGDGPAGTSLDFEPHRGFLRGFIDLVFRSGNRYYLLDWKSNHLGARKTDYTRERMGAEMRAHRYDLQYMLYTVALNRFLSKRLPGYDFDTHFGGVLYLFVRGIDCGSAPGCGIFSGRPAPDAVRALDDFLYGGG